MILTGTPVANRPFDIWAQIFFLDSGDSLGTDFKTFKKMVDIPKSDLNTNMIENYTRVLTSIFPKLDNFCFRETKKTTSVDLPELTKKDILCDWEETQLNMYENVKNEIEMRVIREGVTEYDISEEIAKKLLRLIQAASNPILIDENYKNKNGKFHKIIDLLSTIPKDDKIIIWTGFVRNVMWLHKEISKLSINTAYIHGRISIEERNEQKRKFIDNKDVRVLIANPSAAKEGLTLTNANHAIYFDRNFTLDDYLQSQARIHRISQKKKCIIYHLIMAGSIDKWVGSYLYLKELAAQLTQGDITPEEFETLAPRNIKSQLMEVLGNVD